MDLGLHGKVALVADGTSAVGIAIARLLAAEGASVVIAGAQASRVDRAQTRLCDAGVEMLAVTADVASHAGVAKLVDEVLNRFGRIDVVVSHCGDELPGTTADVTSDQLAGLLAMKVLVPWDLARSVASHMRKQRSGRFIVVISDAGKIPGRSMTASAVAGAAQHAMVKSMADELGPDNVLVTGVSIGHISDPDGAVPPIERDFNICRSLAQQESGWAADVPLGRWGTPDDVANAVVFLASESAGFICGSNLDVDGGDQRTIF